MSELKTYQCHKRVKATKIHAISTERHLDGSTWINGEIRVDKKYMRKHQPQVGGYYVVYEDGYQSFSPAEAFESGYTEYVCR